ncbi:unnamed protein product [Rhodiola kirilowii]
MVILMCLSGIASLQCFCRILLRMTLCNPDPKEMYKTISTLEYGSKAKL